jgi:hypothetical protein
MGKTKGRKKRDGTDKRTDKHDGKDERTKSSIMGKMKGCKEA